jgi:hypothetical protein
MAVIRWCVSISASHGMAGGDCTSQVDEEAEGHADGFVFTCEGIAGPSASCTGVGGTFLVRDTTLLTGEELFYADGLGEWITFESSGLDAGGGDPGEVCEPFTVACVDTIIASQAFAAGFVIVGLCWAMARGPKLILDFIRKF